MQISNVTSMETLNYMPMHTSKIASTHVPNNNMLQNIFHQPSPTMLKPEGKIIKICFYEPKANDVWMNRLVASMGKHYVSHVEIMFEDGMAASIFAEDVVFWKERTYSNPQYKILGVEVPTKSYWQMYNHAQDTARRQVGFDNVKMFCGPFMGYRGSSDRTYCSEFVTQTLQVGGVKWAMKMNASRSTPSGLLDFMLNNCYICFDTTAYKLGQAFG